MQKTITVQDLMSTKLVTLHPKDKLERVKEIFDKYSVHHIPVVVNESIVGLVSKSDFIISSFGKFKSHLNIACLSSWDVG